MANFEDSDTGLLGGEEENLSDTAESLFIDEEGDIHSESEEGEEEIVDPYDALTEEYD